MAKRTIETVVLEASSLAAEVKEVVGGSTAQARNLVEIGRVAFDALFELSAHATLAELRSHAALLRGAAIHSLLCSNELTTGAARLEQLAAIHEAARADE